MASTSTVDPASADTAPSARHVFNLAWPMTLKAVILHGTVVIDAYLVSSLGETSLAAMGLAAALGGTVLGAGFAFSGAIQIRAAQANGARDMVFLKSVLASGLALSTTIGLFGLFLIWTLGPTLLSALAPDQVVADLAWTYLSIFSLVILGEAVGQSLSSFFNGCGQTKIPLVSFSLSLPINVASSVIFINGHFGLPAFGVSGAAMGSALAIGVQLVFLLTLLKLRHGHLRQVEGWHHGSFTMAFRRHFKFAAPIGATFFSATFASHVSMMIYAQMSLYSFAAMTLIIPWNMVAGQISMQWAQATGITVARLLGQRTPEAMLDRFLSRAWRGAFVAACGVGMVYVALYFAVDTLYSDLADETRAILIGFLPLLVVLQFPRSTNAICGNTLRASGDTVYVMHIFVWAQWLFRVPATALLVLYFQAPAFWVLALIMGEELLKFPFFHRRLYKGAWKHAEVGK